MTGAQILQYVALSAVIGAGAGVFIGLVVSSFVKIFK